MANVRTDEQERLAALRRFELLDTPPEPEFDRITSIAAALFDVPIAAVSLVDAARVWFKAKHGLDLDSMNCEPGFCVSAIHHDEPWVVSDARSDDQARDNTLVVDGGIRFYAGAPLRTKDGFRIGMMCVLDRRPRRFTADQLRLLSDLAGLVMDQIELRVYRQGRSPEPPLSELGVSWEPPPAPKTRTVDDWADVLAAVAQKPGVWARIAHYAGETSAYRAASQLRRQDLPPGEWEFAARRADTGSDLYARVSLDA